jgi:hypothetical protein
MSSKELSTMEISLFTVTLLEVTNLHHMDANARKLTSNTEKIQNYQLFESNHK